MKTTKGRYEYIYNEFDNLAEQFQDDFKASGFSYISVRLRRALIDHMVRFLDNSRLDILDLGCNNGLTGRELCNAFKRRNVETYIDGIDLVDSALEIAKKTFNYRSTYAADITDNKLISQLLGNRTYTLVHSCEVFHHINPVDYKIFFEIAYSRLTHGGHFLLITPNVRSITHLISKIVTPDQFNTGCFQHDYDLSLIKSLLKDAGFSIVAIYGAEILTNLKINLGRHNRIKDLFSYEIAILAKKT